MTKKSPRASRNSKPPVGLTCAADLAPYRRRFLWAPYIAEGKVTIVLDATAAPTSVITSYLAAKASAGGEIPYGRRDLPPGRVIVVAHRGAIKSIRPRLEAAGADLTRVKFLHDVDGRLGIDTFDPAIQCERLEEAIRASFGGIGVALVEVPTEGTGVALADDLKPTMRRLNRLARRLDVAIVVVLVSTSFHGARQVTQTAQALAWLRAVGAVCVVTRDPSSQLQRFTSLKNIVGQDTLELRFRVESTVIAGGIPAATITWDDAPLTIPARKLAEETPVPTPTGRKVDQAMDFVQEVLGQGAMRGKELTDLAARSGISEITLRRAVERLSVVKSSGVWALPQVSVNS